MNLKVIAEGVENREQVNYLTTIQCDYLQGHYLSKALDVDEIKKMFIQRF